MPYPCYPSINLYALNAILCRLFGLHRSFRLDAHRFALKLDPPIHYSGLENIPEHGPLLITANHYARPGFNTAWIAIGITAPFQNEVAWIMSNEWLFLGNPFAFLLRPAMRFVLRSLTVTYRFLPMPTMIGGYSTPQERTSGVRKVVERLRSQPASIIGLTPEGMDSPEGRLGLPPAGAGKFISFLHQMGLPILPVGVSEKDGALQVRFGTTLSIPADLNGVESDHDLAVRQWVMAQISPLLN